MEHGLRREAQSLRTKLREAQRLHLKRTKLGAPVRDLRSWALNMGSKEVWAELTNTFLAYKTGILPKPCAQLETPVPQTWASDTSVDAQEKVAERDKSLQLWTACHMPGPGTGA